MICKVRPRPFSWWFWHILFFILKGETLFPVSPSIKWWFWGSRRQVWSPTQVRFLFPFFYKTMNHTTSDEDSEIFFTVKVKRLDRSSKLGCAMPISSFRMTFAICFLCLHISSLVVLRLFAQMDYRPLRTPYRV